MLVYACAVSCVVLAAHDAETLSSERLVGHQRPAHGGFEQALRVLRMRCVRSFVTSQ